MVATQHKIHALPLIPGTRIAFVQGRWHAEHTNVLIAKCTEILVAHGALAPEVHQLPGSLELPLAAQHLARRDRKLEAIIACGIILKGETDHYQVVRDSCFSGLTQVMLQEDIPIIIEVLPVHDIQLAIARCSDNEFNKGIEAAKAAIEVIDWRRRHAALTSGR